MFYFLQTILTLAYITFIIRIFNVKKHKKRDFLFESLFLCYNHYYTKNLGTPDHKYMAGHTYPPPQHVPGGLHKQLYPLPGCAW